ncbi:MAG: hypothetical protein LC659_01760 [Myxococcales bacterium]|nr:hypothetical protein [Myxococcales bacterium]
MLLARSPRSRFCSTAFFYYLLHFQLLGAVSLLLRLDAQQHALAPACAAYHRYKRALPDGWTRYI